MRMTRLWFVAAICVATTEVQSQSILIQGASVVDGTGAPARIADVRIANGRITAPSEVLELTFGDRTYLARLGLMKPWRP